MISYDAVIALAAVASLLLAWAGVMKVISPHPVADFTAELGLPARIWQARVLGLVEILAGAWAFAFGGPAASATVGAFYMMFTVVVLRARVKGSHSCGCFGQAATPTSWLHVAGNLALGSSCLVSTASGGSPHDLVLIAWGESPLLAAALAVALTALAGVFVVLFTALPELLRAKQPTIRRRKSAGAGIATFRGAGALRLGTRSGGV